MSPYSELWEEFVKTTINSTFIMFVAIGVILGITLLIGNLFPSRRGPQSIPPLPRPKPLPRTPLARG